MEKHHLNGIRLAPELAPNQRTKIIVLQIIWLKVG